MAKIQTLLGVPVKLHIVFVVATCQALIKLLHVIEHEILMTSLLKNNCPPKVYVISRTFLPKYLCIYCDKIEIIEYKISKLIIYETLNLVIRKNPNFTLNAVVNSVSSFCFLVEPSGCTLILDYFRQHIFFSFHRHAAPSEKHS